MLALAVRVLVIQVWVVFFTLSILEGQAVAIIQQEALQHMAAEAVQGPLGELGELVEVVDILLTVILGRTDKGMVRAVAVAVVRCRPEQATSEGMEVQEGKESLQFNISHDSELRGKKMRVACIDTKTKEVINVIIVDSLDKVPDIVYVDDWKIVRKSEVEIVETEVGSVGDLYVRGKGFYRFVGE